MIFGSHYMGYLVHGLWGDHLDRAVGGAACAVIFNGLTCCFPIVSGAVGLILAWAAAVGGRCNWSVIGVLPLILKLTRSEMDMYSDRSTVAVRRQMSSSVKAEREMTKAFSLHGIPL